MVFDTATGAVLRKLQDSQGADYDELGFTAVAIGDLDGDGEVDIVTGARSGDRPKRPDLGRVVVFLADGDCDGDGVPRSGNDCDDADPTVRPGAPEICDWKDNDCDVLVDEAVSVPETCNGADDNCNGLIDENNPGGGTSCSTGGAGVCAAATMTCSDGLLACLADRGRPGPNSATRSMTTAMARSTKARIPTPTASQTARTTVLRPSMQARPTRTMMGLETRATVLRPSPPTQRRPRWTTPSA